MVEIESSKAVPPEPKSPGAASSAAVVIPARLGSRRFPRKVLARATGKYLVQHVWEAVVDCPGVSRVIIATDSDEVASAVASFGGEARMTSPDHVSGTDRVAEVARELDVDFVINVQGDEPHIEHRDLEVLLGLFESSPGEGGLGDVHMTTLGVRRHDREGFEDPNIVKAVFGRTGRALYFSRATVPFYRDAPSGEPVSSPSDGVPFEWWQHLGIYGYRREFLLEYSALEPTPLERRERLEQLRALENGFVIRVGESTGHHIGIDTPEEYERFVEELGREATAGAKD